MDKLIITIPDWVVAVMGLWFIVQIVENVVNIYLFYMDRKIKKLFTTSCTASAPCFKCEFYRNKSFNYCGYCGAKL